METIEAFDILEIFSIPGLCGSRTQAKKMLTQGGLYVWDEGWFKIPPDSQHIILPENEDAFFRAGKRKFMKMEAESPQ